MSNPVLDVSQLHTHFFTRSGVIKAVNGISLSVNRGEILGLVGESGSGKSITGFSIMGLVDEPGRIVSGSINLNGQELVGLPDQKMRNLRGNKVSMIFQDPMMTLNPVLRIGTQMMEAITTHHNVSKKEARKRARDGLAQVGIPSPEERLDAYPHQLSGGMRQRVAIAISFLNNPELIIADEPTTALDVTIQSQILAVAQQLCQKHNTAMIWITHDLSVVSGLADKIAVMYAGRIVEQGNVDQVIDTPKHHYTDGLIKSVPAANSRGSRLFQIPGITPSLLGLDDGCAYRWRCPATTEICNQAPKNSTTNDVQFRCFHPLHSKEIVNGE